MTDIPNEVNRHKHDHFHTHVEQTGKLHSTNFFGNIQFPRSKGGFMFIYLPHHPSPYISDCHHVFCYCLGCP